MSQDKINIDQLFRAKLKDYEATPPPSAWEHIAGELRVHQRTGKIIFLKRAGAAAAVAALFLAGWWLFRPVDLSNSNENAAMVRISPESGAPNPVESAQLQPSPVKPAAAENKASGIKGEGITNAGGGEYKPSLNSMAVFAPGTALLNKSSEPAEAGTKETALFDIEKEFLSHFSNDVKIIKQFADKVISINDNGRPNDTILKNSQVIRAMRQPNANKLPVFATEPKKERTDAGRGNWIVSAELSPITIAQRQGGSSITGQETSYENSVTGSMLAGYRIGKKVTIKSGVILNQLKQVTRFSEYPPAYASDAATFKNSNVVTTSGSVNLDRVVALKSDVLVANEVIATPGIRSELKQEFRFIEIPVEMVYQLIDRKFNVGVTGGISTNILAGNRAGLYENGQRINNGRTSNIRDITYSGAIGLELGYDLSNRVTLTVEPHLKRFLNSVSSNKEIDFKPYQVDIMTGVTYSFN